MRSLLSSRALGGVLLVLAACGPGGEVPEPAEEVPPPAEEPPGDEGVAPTGHETPVAAGRLTVVYTNNIDGEIEPCG